GMARRARRIADVLYFRFDVAIRCRHCQPRIITDHRWRHGRLGTGAADEKQRQQGELGEMGAQHGTPCTCYWEMVANCRATWMHRLSRSLEKAHPVYRLVEVFSTGPYSALNTVMCLTVSGKRRLTSPWDGCSSSPSHASSRSRPR